jgi:hypothetical protein
MTVFYDDFYSNSLTISNASRFRGIFLGNFFGNFFWKFFSLKTYEPTVPAYVNQKKCKKGHQFNVNNYCRGLTKGFYHCAACLRDSAAFCFGIPEKPCLRANRAFRITVKNVSTQYQM